MATMRTYGDRCGVARALDLVGERWALLIVRELLLGPKRFTDLRTGLPNAKPSILSQRLRELEEGGVLRRRRLGPPTGAWVYELTDGGRELEPIVIELGRWGRRVPAERGAALGVDSVILKLKWRFDPEAAGRLSASYEIGLGDDRFQVQIRDRRIEARRGEGEALDATIETDPATFEAILFDGRELDDAVRAGDVTLAGSTELVERLIALYASEQTSE